MAVAEATREETGSKIVNGAIIGTTSTIAGIGTIAAGAHVAHNGFNIKDAANKVVDFSKEGASKAQEVASVAPEIGNKAAAAASSFKEKAGNVFTSLQDKVGGLKQSFVDIPDPKVKAAIIAAAAVVALTVGKVTHDKLHANDNQVNPYTDKVAHVSNGVARGQTSELAV